MSCRAEALVLALFGAVLLRLACGGSLLGYVRAGARPLVLAAAVILVLLALAVLVVGGGGSGSRPAYLLLAPVLAIALVAPPPLGALTASRPPVTPARPSSGFPSLPMSDPVDLRIRDVVLRSVWGAAGTLRGRRLRVIGFVVRPTADGFVLARLVITCCAADAQPFDVGVVRSGRAPPAGTWLAVTGRYAGPSAAGRLVPRLRADAVARVPQPAEPYG